MLHCVGLISTLLLSCPVKELGWVGSERPLASQNIGLG